MGLRVQRNLPVRDRVVVLAKAGNAEEIIPWKFGCLPHISQYLKLGLVFGVSGNCKHKAIWADKPLAMYVT